MFAMDDGERGKLCGKRRGGEFWWSGLGLEEGGELSLEEEHLDGGGGEVVVQP